MNSQEELVEPQLLEFIVIIHLLILPGEITASEP